VDDGFGGYQFVGTLSNDAPLPVDNPSIAIFGVNAAGRPLFEARDDSTTTIAPGSSWSFTTQSFDEMPLDYVVFVHGATD
jgi:hypothetical protein